MGEYRKDALEASEDEEIIGLYDKELHLEMLHNSELREAREKGIEQGIEQGIEKGIEQGIEQGRKEEKIETAKNMLIKGIDIKIISECTNLSIKEIEELK